MGRIDRIKRVDPAQADRYAEVGRRLLHAGRSILEQGDSRHASALAILAVHTVIAYSDAMCIHAGGRKSTGADHAAAVRLLRNIAGSRLPLTIERCALRVLSEKDRLEYQGVVVRLSEAQALFGRAEQFAAWAEQFVTMG